MLIKDVKRRDFDAIVGCVMKYVVKLSNVIYSVGKWTIYSALLHAQGYIERIVKARECSMQCLQNKIKFYISI